MTVFELPPLRHAMAIQVGLAFIAGFLDACGLTALFGLFIGPVTANTAPWNGDCDPYARLRAQASGPAVFHGVSKGRRNINRPAAEGRRGYAKWKSLECI
jgi:hypothetical protein